MAESNKKLVSDDATGTRRPPPPLPRPRKPSAPTRPSKAIPLQPQPPPRSPAKTVKSPTRLQSHGTEKTSRSDSESMTAPPNDAVKDLIQCAVCFESYVQPRILPCDHSFCERCVNQLKAASTIRCPMCKSSHDVSKIRPDFRLQQFLDALKETKQTRTTGTYFTPAAFQNQT